MLCQTSVSSRYNGTCFLRVLLLAVLQLLQFLTSTGARANLTVLSLDECRGLRHETLAHLGACSKLENINLRRLPAVRDETLVCSSILRIRNRFTDQ